MERLIRPAVMCLTLLLLAIVAVNPFEPNLRLGKDLRGGTTLVYQVEIDEAENAGEVIARTIDVLKNRIDPNGLLEIQMVRQGNDRIEITMPLPDDATIALRDAYLEKLNALEGVTIEAQTVSAAMALEPGRRDEVLAQFAGDDEEILSQLTEAIGLFDAQRAATQRAEEAEESGVVPEDELDRLAIQAADLNAEFVRFIEGLASQGIDTSALRRALQLSDQERRLVRRSTGEIEPLPSPRDVAIGAIRDAHPDQAAAIDEVVAAFEAYEENRTSLDDPADLQRLVSASGVPSFRITIDPQSAGTTNTFAQEARARQLLREGGPDNASLRGVRWCPINDIDTWVSSVEEVEALQQDPAAFFETRGYIVEPYLGEFFMLCWATRASSLTVDDGDWAVARAFQTVDQLGRPAVGFQMDPRGAKLLGTLTAANLNNQMAVLLDEEVYTAPNLRGAISSQGVIEGRFSLEEINYIIRVLSAGSLSARLSPEPLSVNTVAPDFGQDNLDQGRTAGMWALALVSGFMVAYYFAFGVVAVASLLFNAAIILGAVALARASFTLPGIAGVILTFGMAVDANVLIYERIREETRKGADLRAAARLGYQKALSAIVDGNVTNLIVCFVLGTLGTPEIKGFAITLGIGVIGTMISALVFTRLLLNFFIEVLGWKKLGMLPTSIPVLERILEPKINWIGFRYFAIPISIGLVALGIGLTVRQGEEMLDTEFRGGTAATLDLKDESGEPITLTRQNVEDRIDDFAAELIESDPENPLVELAAATILPINPQSDGVSSDTFTIKTYVTDREAIQEALVRLFEDELGAEPPVRFRGDEEDFGSAPVFAIVDDSLNRVLPVDLPAGRAGEFLGGVAILLEGINPAGDQPVSIESIETKISNQRQSEDFENTIGRPSEVRLLAGTDTDVRAAVVLVREPGASAIGTEDQRSRWTTELAAVEWNLTRSALRDVTTLFSIQSFSPAIAESFRQTAIVSVVLSLLLILIYIWVRFGSVRYSFAAIATLTHDVIAAVGLIAIAEIAYESEATAGIAQSLGIEPFKIDLTLIAAILTIIGYSLNDTIIIMDRIRENRGRLPYATKQIVNDAINQTISRTVITSGTTFIATLILFTSGGAGVKAFAYALLIGVVVGTYSSIAVASPLVWSRRKDRSEPEGTKRRLA